MFKQKLNIKKMYNEINWDYKTKSLLIDLIWRPMMKELQKGDKVVSKKPGLETKKEKKKLIKKEKIDATSIKIDKNRRAYKNRIKYKAKRLDAIVTKMEKLDEQMEQAKNDG